MTRSRLKIGEVPLLSRVAQYTHLLPHGDKTSPPPPPPPPFFPRYNRDYVVEGEPYAGYDRHNAEVAAFHLDRYAYDMFIPRFYTNTTVSYFLAKT